MEGEDRKVITSLNILVGKINADFSCLKNDFKLEESEKSVIDLPFAPLFVSFTELGLGNNIVLFLIGTSHSSYDTNIFNKLNQQLFLC